MDFVDLGRSMVRDSLLRILDGTPDRPVSVPSCVILNSGRRVLYFSVDFKGPDSSFSLTAAGFLVSYGPGTVELGGNTVSWTAGTVEVPPSSSVYISVGPTGLVEVLDKIEPDRAPIAQVRSSITEAVDLSRFFPRNRVVFQYAQVLDVNSQWTWVGAVLIPLSSGENPRATYDRVSDTLRITYLRNGSVYLRTVETGTDITSLSWLKDSVTTSTTTFLNDVVQSAPLASSYSQSNTLTTHSDKGYHFLLPAPTEELDVSTAYSAALSGMSIPYAIPLRLLDFSAGFLYIPDGGGPGLMGEVPVFLAGSQLESGGGVQDYTVYNIRVIKPDETVLMEIPYAPGELVILDGLGGYEGPIGFGMEAGISYVPGGTTGSRYESDYADSVKGSSSLESTSDIRVFTFLGCSSSGSQSTLSTHSNKGYHFLLPAPTENQPLSCAASASLSNLSLTNP